MQSKFIHSGHIQLHYRLAGEGMPLLFVHSFGVDGNTWQNQIDYFKDKYKLIIPDLPGSGKSVMDHEPWTIDRFADILKLIFDEESIEDCTMIGHSIGGYITLAFEDKFPGYLSGFGLFHSTAFADSEEKKQQRIRGIEFIKEYGPQLFLKQTLPGLFTEQFRKQNAAVISALLEAAKSFSAESLIAYYEAMMNRPDRSDVLKQSVKPVLLIMGEEDKAVPLADSLQQCSFAERSLIKILPQVVHMGMLEAKDECNKTLGDFMALCTY
jgi:pimeloyl-ACP methyl ester carboxylesterase